MWIKCSLSLRNSRMESMMTGEVMPSRFNVADDAAASRSCRVGPGVSVGPQPDQAEAASAPAAD